MTGFMPDSRLNAAERRLQHSLRIMNVFKGLLMAGSVGMAYFSIRDLPQRQALPSAQVPLTYRFVNVAPSAGPLRLAGAWELSTEDRRFGGLSSLALDQGRFLAVSDRGAVTRFDPPASAAT